MNTHKLKTKGKIINVLMIAIIIITLIYSVNLALAQAEIDVDSIDYPSPVLQYEALNISFNADSNLEEAIISYSIYLEEVNGSYALVSNNYYYSVLLDETHSGTYNYMLVAQDGEFELPDAEYISVEVVEVPLDIVLLNPSTDYSLSRNVLINVSVSPKATSCYYSTNNSLEGELTKSTETNYYKTISFSNDGAFSIYIDCEDSATESTGQIQKNIKIDTIAPLITSKTSTLNSDNLILISATTNEISNCKYDSSDKSYSQMLYSFDATNAYSHSTSIAASVDGTYVYYVRCRDEAGNAMLSSESITFTLSQAPSATISIDHASPLKAGTYAVRVITSQSVQNSPTLYYTFHDDLAQKPISLIGAGTDWHGYMIIDEDTPNKVGTFHFSAIDFDGVTGTLITQGELFLVDTIKPPSPSSIEGIAEDDGDIKIKWYYDGEQTQQYKIYRSTDYGVGYVNYYTTVSSSSFSDSSSLQYVDDDVDAGTTYYYKVSAIDEAENEGPLSDVVAVDSMINQDQGTSQLIVASQNLATTLIPKVDAQISVLQTMLMDIQSKKIELNKITDSSKLKAISLLKLSEKANNAETSINTLIQQANDLKKQDLSASELDVRLNKLNMDAIKAETMVAEDIIIEEFSTFEQLTQEGDVEEAITSLTEKLNLSEKTMQNYSSINKLLQDSVSIKAEALIFKIKYLNKDDYDEYTIVKKTIVSNNELTNIAVVEIIPKDVARKASDMIFGFENQDYPVIVKEDPILKWNFDTMSSESVYYQISSIIDLTSLKNTKTIVLTKPDFKFSDTIKETKNSENLFTGMMVFEQVNLTKLSAVQWMVMGGLVVMIGLLIYYFIILPYQEKKHNQERKKQHSILPLQHKMLSPKSNAQTSMQTNTLGSQTSMQTNASGSQTSMQANNLNMQTNNLKSQIIRQQTGASKIYGASAIVNAKINSLEEKIFMNNLIQCNTHINKKNYMKSHNLYCDLLKGFNATNFREEGIKKEARKLLRHIYLKLLAYRKIHECHKHVDNQNNIALKYSCMHLGELAKNIEIGFNKELAYFEENLEKIEEEAFLGYLNVSKEYFVDSLK